MRMFLRHFNKIVNKNGGAECPTAGGERVTLSFSLRHIVSIQFNSDYYTKMWDADTVPVESAELYQIQPLRS